MSEQWKKGRVLWFDDLSGEGMVFDENGNNIFFHYSTIKKSKKSRKTIEKDTPVKFTVYENGYIRQVDELVECKS